MARWILECHSCGTEFTHSEIDASIRDPFTNIELKPEFPDRGKRVVCPNCRNSSIYQRFELLYRASAKAARP
jgi:uncharacterized protein (DUF983 family)